MMAGQKGKSMGEIVKGQIVDVRQDGKLVILADVPDLGRACYRQYKDCLIELADGRTRSPKQLRKCYVLLNAISAWSGYTPIEAVKEMMKLAYKAAVLSLEPGLFSLATINMTDCRHFIDFLVKFCLQNGVPTYRVGMYDLCEDISLYVYNCLVNKRCAVCGRKADLHHVDRVGMGRNRRTINHIGLRALPLCREHHTLLHSTSEAAFMKKYHLVPVEIDERIAAIYHLKRG